MPIYFLRHEKRDMSNPTFHTNLTAEGHQGAQKLKTLLSDLKITKVYSSPFIRCLQTVKPFVEDHKLNVCVDWGIQEFFFHHAFNSHNYTELSDQEKIFYRVDSKYKSSMKPNVLRYQEMNDDFVRRVTEFFIKLKIENQSSDENILVCTHMGVVNVLLSLFKVKREFRSLYMMGRVSKVVNGKVKYLN